MRVYNSGDNSYTIPPSGEVTIRAVWSTGERNKINVSPDCKYTVTGSFGSGGSAAAPSSVDQSTTCKCEESYNNGKKQRNRCIPPVPPWNPTCFSKGYTIFTDVLIDDTNCTCDMEFSSHPAVSLSGTPSTSAPSVTSNNYITVIVLIIQFKVPYQMSEITSDLQTKIATAVANVIGVNVSTVSLTFVEVDLRRQGQQKGVLINVGLKDFQGATSPYVSRLTQDVINTQMSQLGLRSVQVIPSSSVKPASSAVRMLTSIETTSCVVFTVSLLMVSLSV